MSQSPASPQASPGARSSDSEAKEAKLRSARLGVKGVSMTPAWSDRCCVPALTPQGNCRGSPQATCPRPCPNLHSGFSKSQETN